MHKLIATVSNPEYPRLSARVVKVTDTEFHIGVWLERTDTLYSPVSLPRFRTIIEPSLYVHPSEVLSFLSTYACQQIDKAATDLIGTGEWVHAD